MQNCWNGKGKNKTKQWKPMVVERGKTCSKSKEKYNFKIHMNMKIMEHARSMRLHVGFPLQFWEDVVDIVV